MHVGRYAPTPSGELHLGNARTALLAWLWARADGGRVLLRIEDLDRARTRPGCERRQRDELAALGLDWDGAVTRQSERGLLYEDALARLDRANLLYPCFCSRADVRAASLAPHGPEGPRYPGTCRDLPEAERARRLATGRRASLRLRMPSQEIVFEDGVHGLVRERPAETAGDIVVRRSDGVVAYHLAVVVDDAAQGVTHVLRGDDLLASTARQIALAGCLGFEPRRYAHVPLLLGADGARLAKRHGAVGVGTLLASGVCGARIVGWLAMTAGLAGDAAPRRPGDLVGAFSLRRLRREPWTVREPPEPRC